MTASLAKSRSRTVVGATLALLLAAAVFVFLHTGTRAQGLCESRVFTRAGHFAPAHLGVQCEYGDTTQFSYERGVSFFVFVTFALAWCASVGATVISLRDRGAATSRV